MVTTGRLTRWSTWCWTWRLTRRKNIRIQKYRITNVWLKYVADMAVDMEFDMVADMVANKMVIMVRLTWCWTWKLAWWPMG